jgi:hypothetical protein
VRHVVRQDPDKYACLPPAIAIGAAVPVIGMAVPVCRQVIARRQLKEDAELLPGYSSESRVYRPFHSRPHDIELGWRASFWCEEHFELPLVEPFARL